MKRLVDCQHFYNCYASQIQGNPYLDQNSRRVVFSEVSHHDIVSSKRVAFVGCSGALKTFRKRGKRSYK